MADILVIFLGILLFMVIILSSVSIILNKNIKRVPIGVSLALTFTLVISVIVGLFIIISIFSTGSGL